MEDIRFVYYGEYPAIFCKLVDKEHIIFVSFIVNNRDRTPYICIYILKWMSAGEGGCGKGNFV